MVRTKQLGLDLPYYVPEGNKEYGEWVTLNGHRQWKEKTNPKADWTVQTVKSLAEGFLASSGGWKKQPHISMTKERNPNIMQGVTNLSILNRETWIWSRIMDMEVVQLDHRPKDGWEGRSLFPLLKR